jgi:hypothetical protein
MTRSRVRRELPAAILADYHLLDGVTITADPSDAMRRRAAERGFGYLDKPLRIERLRSLLAHMLAAA